MRVKCDYCKQMVDESLEKCPHCGATISAVNRVASEQPKTIDELRQWYEAHHLPPEEVTRFFIGKDIKEPKAFGIYKADNGDFVVYKNKSTGERAIRYQGIDEGYAVNELYQRLKAEIADQKEHRAEVKYNSRPSSRSKSNVDVLDAVLNFPNMMGKALLVFFAICIIIAIIEAIVDNNPENGYYRYKGNDYYYQNSYWYKYDKILDAWSLVENDNELDSNIYDDTYEDYQIYDHEGSDFEDTTWYDSGRSDDSDWDNDSYWDSDDDYDWDWDSDSDYDYGGGWDSDYSDWDSDW